MQNYEIEVKSFGRVLPKTGYNTRTLFEHQRMALENLNLINQNSDFSTLLVLPTGGGKTYTASTWLLRNALDQHTKILWLAHRQMLLEQAADSFQKYAYAETIPHISSYTYRIVSGAPSHDRTIDIDPSDQLLIVSKDSIGRNLKALEAWVKGEEEIFLVIDEAHHSTAKTYRKVIDYVRSKVPHVKLFGLTATPFRTAEKEKGLLSKIYQDGIQNGQPVHGDIGITYQIGLKELINRRILSKPVFISRFTDEMYGELLGVNDWESIQHFDVLPDDIAGQIADSAARNRMIVDTFKEKPAEYGQTIVFAVNVTHAITLCALFKKAGIRAEYIVSDIKDFITGVRISREDNERKIEAYRRGDVQVLINVNILTEGIDLPNTKTVFLARPTVSTIMMTQMIGRALRGEAAGGTATAYIVSFIDKWNEHIAWVNPESIFIGENEFSENESDHVKRELRMIAISKIEEFATTLDDSVDTTALEKVPFVLRIPVGMYAFSYLEEGGVDSSYQVMVYDSTKEAYEKMMNVLPMLFADYGVSEEYPAEDVIGEMAEQCRNTVFLGEMVPPLEETDLERIIRYYAQYDTAPKFYTFDDIDRGCLDVGGIAKRIWDEDMGCRKQGEYLNSIWDNQDDNLLKLFFGKKLYFLRQVEIELTKLSDPHIYDEENNVKFGKRKLENLSLYEIRKINPELEKELRDKAFECAQGKDGNYTCACCGKKEHNRIYFQVDHIIPMNRGGKSTLDNLQILCRTCNGIKGNQI